MEVTNLIALRLRVVKRDYARKFIPHAEAIGTRYRDTDQKGNSICFLNPGDEGKPIASGNDPLLYVHYGFVREAAYRSSTAGRVVVWRMARPPVFKPELMP